MPILDVVTVLPSNKENKQCRVCGGAADGVYFGALVCLPCKSFFIRCTKDGDPVDLKCQGARSACFPSDGGRIKCQRCRYAKCLEVGMARRSEKPEVVMPPAGKTLCAVCGDIANGLHFGVMTCEGCKKFFRRSLTEASTYTCKRGQEDCPVNPRTRNECRLCRYNKCVQVGMSREAIKVGRPPVVSKKEGRHHPYSDAASGRSTALEELSHLQAEFSSSHQFAHGYHHQSSVPQTHVTGDASVSSDSNVDFNYLLHYFSGSASSQIQQPSLNLLPLQQQQQHHQHSQQSLLPQHQQQPPDLGVDLESVLAELSESCQYDGLLLSEELDVENMKPLAGHAAHDQQQHALSLSQNRSLLSDVWLQYLLGDDERPPEGNPGGGGGGGGGVSGGWDDRRGGAESRASLQRVEGVMASLEQRADGAAPFDYAVSQQPAAALVPLTFNEDADWIDDVGTKVRINGGSRETPREKPAAREKRREGEQDGSSEGRDQQRDEGDRSPGRGSPGKMEQHGAPRRELQHAQVDRSPVTPMDHQALLSVMKHKWHRALRTLHLSQENKRELTDRPTDGKGSNATSGAAAESHSAKAAAPPTDAWRLLNELAIRSTAAWLLYFQSLPGTGKLSQNDQRALICSAAFGNTVLASVGRQIHGDSSLHWLICDCKLATQNSGLSSWQAFHRRLERCTEAVQKAKPDESECAVLCALMFLSSGAAVKDKALIEREKTDLTNLLKVHIRDTIGDEDKAVDSARSARLNHLLQLLPMLQHLTLWHRHLMRGKRPQQGYEEGTLPPPPLAVAAATTASASRPKPSSTAASAAFVSAPNPAHSHRLAKAAQPLPNIGASAPSGQQQRSKAAQQQPSVS